MPKAETIITTSATGRRRLAAGLLATIAGTGLTSGIAAGVVTVADAMPVHPDAELLALCATATEAANQSDAICDAADNLLLRDPRSDESTRLWNQCRASMDKAMVLPAQTSEGLRAKALLALREFSCDNEVELPLVTSVLKQIAGRL